MNHNHNYVVIVKNSSVPAAFFETKSSARAYVRHMLDRNPHEAFVLYRLTDKEERVAKQ